MTAWQTSQWGLLAQLQGEKTKLTLLTLKFHNANSRLSFICSGRWYARHIFPVDCRDVDSVMRMVKKPHIWSTIVSRELRNTWCIVLAQWDTIIKINRFEGGMKDIQECPPGSCWETQGLCLCWSTFDNINGRAVRSQLPKLLWLLNGTSQVGLQLHCWNEIVRLHRLLSFLYIVIRRKQGYTQVRASPWRTHVFKSL